VCLGLRFVNILTDLVVPTSLGCLSISDTFLQSLCTVHEHAAGIFFTMMDVNSFSFPKEDFSVSLVAYVHIHIRFIALVL
jgi:hypothetical protein